MIARGGSPGADLRIQRQSRKEVGCLAWLRVGSHRCLPASPAAGYHMEWGLATIVNDWLVHPWYSLPRPGVALLELLTRAARFVDK